jgi:DNA adenine methylase Dam
MGNEFLKAPMNYTGNKFKLLSQIIPLFPDNINTFVDLFCGSSTVSLNVHANKIICNDSNEPLIGVLKYLQSSSKEKVLKEISKIIDEFDLYNHENGGYYLLRDRYNEDKRPLDLYVLSCFSFNFQIRFNKRGEYNMPSGKSRSSYTSVLAGNLEKFIDKVKSINITYTSNDFRSFDISLLGENDFVYCDPPYLISNAVYTEKNRLGNGYGEQEETELLNLLDRLNSMGVKFALSNVMYHKGLENTLLIEWSKKYNVHYLDKNYSTCNYQLKERDKTKTVEVLVTNY